MIFSFLLYIFVYDYNPKKMIERIQLIMKSRNISAAQFADEIGVQRSSVSHILTGRNNPSLDIILKILQRFPEINSEWILTGNGAMIKSEIGKSYLPAQNAIISTEKKIEQNNENLGDLFAQPFSQIENEKAISENIKKQLVLTSEDEVKEQKKEVEKKMESPDEVIENTNVRTVDQIVIFYSDKTFSYYTPHH